MCGQIFISYRRDDDKYATGRLYDRLSEHFPKNRIFIDVDNLEPGADFVDTNPIFIFVVGSDYEFGSAPARR